jgi:hypothetical protein
MEFAHRNPDSGNTPLVHPFEATSASNAGTTIPQAFSFR